MNNPAPKKGDILKTGWRRSAVPSLFNSQPGSVLGWDSQGDRRLKLVIQPMLPWLAVSLTYQSLFDETGVIERQCQSSCNFRVEGIVNHRQSFHVQTRVGVENQIDVAPIGPPDVDNIGFENGPVSFIEIYPPSHKFFAADASRTQQAETAPRGTPGDQHRSQST